MNIERKNDSFEKIDFLNSKFWLNKMSNRKALFDKVEGYTVGIRLLDTSGNQMAKSSSITE